MTYAEQESIEYKATIKNDFDKGYDDCMNNKQAMPNASQMYNDGYGLAYGIMESQSVGNN